jgi:hypothetical protein
MKGKKLIFFILLIEMIINIKTGPLFLQKSNISLTRYSNIYKLNEIAQDNNGKTKLGKMWKYDALLYPIYEVKTFQKETTIETCNCKEIISNLKRHYKLDVKLFWKLFYL